MARKKSCKPEQSTAPDTIPSVQKLTSQDAGERAWACIAVGQFCNDPQVCKHLLRNQVIPKLVQLLSDTAPQVVLEALGALRNFMLHNEPINEFINLQGVPAILGILQQTIAEIEKLNFIKVGDANETCVFLVAEQLISIMWSISEVSMEACKHFSDHIIIKFLLDLISKNAEPTLVVSVLQFLNTLTDENPLAINSISPEKVEIFANLSKNQDVQLSILSCCILWNVKSIMRPEDVPEARNMIIMTVTESLKLDLISKCAAADAAGLALDSTVDNVQVSEEALKLGDITNVENSNTTLINEAVKTINAVGLALELLANMYADETTDEWDDDEIMSQGSVDGSNEFEEDMQNVVGDDCSSDDMADTQAQQPKHNVDNSMVLMLLSLASSKISVQSKSADALLGAFGQLRERALGVINNILLLGLSENLNSPTAQFIWDALIAIVNDKCDSGILEAAVTAAWSLSQASCDMIEISEQQIHTMMQMAGHESGLSAMIQVKFVGIVACIARKQGNPASNSIIGNWMMTQIEGMISLGIRMDLIAEHLDAFFDIYADAAFDYNQVFIENQFLERLRAIESAVKVGTKKVDKRTNKDTRIHCDQVALNLPAFIAYKAQE